jgi:hypothetical protein
MDENNNSICGNINNVTLNKDSVITLKEKETKSRIADPSSPAFEFSDMESLSFSSDDDDDHLRIDNEEMEEQYEQQIEQLQREGQQLHKFYLKKCETNKKLTAKIKRLQSRITELTTLPIKQTASSPLLPSSTKNVNSPISAILYLKSQVQTIYAGKDSNDNDTSKTLLKTQEERGKINAKYNILKQSSTLDDYKDEKVDMKNNSDELLLFQNQIKDLTSEMNEMKLFHDSERLSFNEEVKSLTTENNSICEQMDLLNSTLEQSKQELIDLNGTTISLNNQLVKVQQLYSNLMECNRKLKFEKATLKNRIDELNVANENAIIKQSNQFKLEKTKFLELDEAKNREVIAVRNELKVLQSDISEYKEKLERKEQRIEELKLQNEQDLLKEKNSNRRIFAFGEKELARLKKEISTKNNIIDELNKKVSAKENTNKTATNHGNALIENLQNENGRLKHDAEAMKNKMNLLNTLLEKEQIRRKKAEERCPDNIISRRQTLKAMQLVEKQSTQNIKTFKASLSSTLNHALIQVNEIVNINNNNNNNEQNRTNNNNNNRNSNEENELLKKKIRSFFLPLRQQL